MLRVITAFAITLGIFNPTLKDRLTAILPSIPQLPLRDDMDRDNRRARRRERAERRAHHD